MEIIDISSILFAYIGVAAVPGTSFYHSEPGKHKLRFTFSKKDETLQEAARRLEKLNK
ncbi:MAG TPA: hypothetical protein VKL21_05090 [Candidatus Methanoperedens sp.]|nr:hypothetical protein [Candidatus Methanoperedens sp.]